MELTHCQKMILSIAEMARGNFETVVVISGRRSGKGVMGARMIRNEVLRIMDSDLDRGGQILHLSTSLDLAREFSNKMTRELRGFDVKSSGYGNLSIDGDRIRISCGSFKYDSAAISKTPSLTIIDDLPEDLDWANRIFGTDDHLKIVFRTEYMEGDNRPGVLIVNAKNDDLNPTMSPKM